MKIEVDINCSGLGASYTETVTLDDDDIECAAIRQLRETDVSQVMLPAGIRIVEGGTEQ